MEIREAIAHALWHWDEDRPLTSEETAELVEAALRAAAQEGARAMHAQTAEHPTKLGVRAGIAALRGKETDDG